MTVTLGSRTYLCRWIRRSTRKKFGTSWRHLRPSGPNNGLGKTHFLPSCAFVEWNVSPPAATPKHFIAANLYCNQTAKFPIPLNRFDSSVVFGLSSTSGASIEARFASAGLAYRDLVFGIEGAGN